MTLEDLKSRIEGLHYMEYSTNGIVIEIAIETDNPKILLKAVFENGFLNTIGRVYSTFRGEMCCNTHPLIDDGKEHNITIHEGNKFALNEPALI